MNFSKLPGGGEGGRQAERKIKQLLESLTSNNARKLETNIYLFLIEIVCNFNSLSGVKNILFPIHIVSLSHTFIVEIFCALTPTPTLTSRYCDINSIDREATSSTFSSTLIRPSTKNLPSLSRVLFHEMVFSRGGDLQHQSDESPLGEEAGTRNVSSV